MSYILPKSFNGRPYGSPPRSYHRQPAEATEGTTPPPHGGSQYLSDVQTIKHDTSEDDVDYLHGIGFGGSPTDHPAFLPLSYGGMGGHAAGSPGSLPPPSGITNSHYFPHHHHHSQPIYAHFPHGSMPGSGAGMGLSHMHNLEQALNAQPHPGFPHADSPGSTNSSLDDDTGHYSSGSASSNVDYVDQLPSHQETEQYLRRTLDIPPPRPVDLSALPDPADKRHPPITNMIKLAIWGSENKRLTLRQIYEEIENRFESLRNLDDKPWQRSIRHNLSLKAIFVRVERPVTESGKGYYWALNVRAGEGNKRDRKRKDPSRTGADDSEDNDEDMPPVAVGGRSGRAYPDPRNPSLRIPQEQTVLGPSSFPLSTSGSVIRQSSLLNMGHAYPPPNTNPNMRWDRTPYPSPSNASSSRGNRSTASPGQLSGGPPMQGYPTPSAPPSGYMNPSMSQHPSQMMGMPPHGLNRSGSGTRRRPQNDDDDEYRVRSRRRNN